MLTVEANTWPQQTWAYPNSYYFWITHWYFWKIERKKWCISEGRYTTAKMKRTSPAKLPHCCANSMIIFSNEFWPIEDLPLCQGHEVKDPLEFITLVVLTNRLENTSKVVNSYRFWSKIIALSHCLCHIYLYSLRINKSISVHLLFFHPWKQITNVP